MTRRLAFTLPGASRVKPLGERRSPVTTVLDVGSSKICCIIARLSPREGTMLKHRSHTVEVLGFAATRSRGVKGGVVVDLEEAEQAIRLAVDGAERMAGVTVSSLIANLSCGRLKSEAYSASIRLARNVVADLDVQKVLAAGGAHSATAGRVIVHSLPIGFSLDGQRGISDPKGMLGETLGVDMHVVTADEAPLRNLELAINRCHIDLETVVAAPYAAALATLDDDEAELGVAILDMGGGTTTLAVFHEGRFVHADAVAIGGHHVTLDIARGLSARLADAEWLKARHGSALPSVSDEKEILSVARVGEDEREAPASVPKAALTRIIRPRVEETLELARDMIARSGHAATVGKRVVLTGGASQLTGVAETARRIVGRNVRLGRPLAVSGLPETARTAAYATTVGLAIYPQVARIEQFEAGRAQRPSATGTDGAFVRFGRWLKESF